ncbi:aminotransferase class I/II-fold pyridoxal phosphate-dependent enzyme [Novosphingobium sp.]|uniref:pyridoxal phosphate-dependent aminotransferase n=1 Tax=Novosphingobium sp. TaxID=1874826 RepID=UPI0025D7EF73|nr:aminotransferase class I/II-fold pyridoxal phosphate-dependent enzyme [Novosphingobium sp.]
MTAQIEPFHAIKISLLAHELKASGRSVIHMEFGQPSTGAPSAAIARAHEVLDSDPMGYWQSPFLKERICAHYFDNHGVTIDPRQIVLTCGASPALVLALSVLFAPGARVAIARPGYVAYRNTLKSLHLEPIELDCGSDTGFQITAALLANLDPVPDGLILASPANPTGTIIPRAELVAIAALCRQRSIAIISDEVYQGISYGPETPSLLEVDPEALVINSFSKYFSMAGWRLGWLVAPHCHVNAAVARMSNLFLTPPSLSQHVGLVAMDCRDELNANLATYARNRSLLLDALPGMGIGKFAPPDGAFYIYADVSEFTDDSMDLCLNLLRDTGVAVAPGIDFDPVDGHHYLRISFAVSTPEVEEAIARLSRWFAGRKPGQRSS